MSVGGILRVGLSVTTAEPALTGGRLDGLGVYSRALLEHLPHAGAEVLPFSFAPPGDQGKLKLGRALPVSFPVATLGDLLLPSSVHLSTRAVLQPNAPPPGPIDLFHATDYRIVRMDCPVVATLHDALPVSHPEWASPKLRKLKNWLQAKAARKAQHVITGSRFSIRELVECFGVDENRISVVHHGVRAEWFDQPDVNERDITLGKHNLRPGYFLFVGTLQPRKNVGRLLDAYLALPPVLRAARQLVIVGAPGWRSEELVKRIKAAQQQGENVVWLDQLTDDRHLHHLYAGAGAFIFPSLHEGFGLPVLEAMQLGTPVLTSAVGAPAEIAGDAALLVDPYDVAAIAAGISALDSDAGLRDRMAAAGAAAAARFSAPAYRTRLEQMYARVLDAPLRAVTSSRRGRN